MKKRILSLCMVLALCLSLLPATALAAAPSGQELYVGGVQISSTGYWTTDSEGNVTAYSGAGTPSDNYIHYDADNNTLTLHNATIKAELPYNAYTPAGRRINGSAIGVLNESGNAELIINLEGANTIENVSQGIYVLSASTGTAILIIEGGGSLNASGYGNPGIRVLSNNGDATLSIQDAEVEATGTSVAGHGVLVQAGGSSDASLTVEGGGLTATGGSSSGLGIYFYGPSASNIKLSVSNNAIVRADGGIASGTNEDEAVTIDGTGIVFNNGTGAVYGDVTLQDNLEIGEDESLDIPSGSSLTIPNNITLTNDGTVTNSGTLTNNGTINNSGTLPDNIGGTAPPSITTTSPLASGTVGTAYRNIR